MFCVTVQPMRTWLSDYVAKVGTLEKIKGE